jgi:hypothetical protein
MFVKPLIFLFFLAVFAQAQYSYYGSGGKKDVNDNTAWQIDNDRRQ